MSGYSKHVSTKTSHSFRIICNRNAWSLLESGEQRYIKAIIISEDVQLNEFLLSLQLKASEHYILKLAESETLFPLIEYNRGQYWNWWRSCSSAYSLVFLCVWFPFGEEEERRRKTMDIVVFRIMFGCVEMRIWLNWVLRKGALCALLESCGFLSHRWVHRLVIQDTERELVIFVNPFKPLWSVDAGI